jgi:thiosulfate/3-mercaptopyruvate sulfurtransferase
VRLLNGGWRGWQTIDGTIEKTSPPATTNTLVLHPDRTLLANKNDVLKELKQGKDQIVDARSFKEFCGTTKLARRGGAMPDAKHLEWSAVIERKTQRFKSADELKKLFRTAGIDLNQPTVTHCQSGGRSSVMAFTLELMGAKDVRNYYRGWSEWGNAKDTPIVQPNKK